MKVIKRNGHEEAVKFDKILARIKKQMYGLNTEFLDPFIVAQQVIQGLFDGITTQQLDTLAAETAASLTTTHPDYSKLAARISVTALHKDTNKKFSQVVKSLYNYVDPKDGLNKPKVSQELMDIVKENGKLIDSQLIWNRDLDFDFFGFKTLERAYLLKIDSKIVERPQHLWMRVALGIHGNNLERAFETYELMSTKWFTHATPTLFNAGTPRNQLSSCFLVANKADSINGLFDTLHEVANISKWAGGEGIHIHNVRAKDSLINGTGGKSDGIMPMLRTYNEVARWINQGGKRKGSFAMYLEPWHKDIYNFLDAKKNHGKEEMRARDLFYGLWVPDLFMKRVIENGDWTLFCPTEAPLLPELYGKEFEDYYVERENAGLGSKTIKAQDLYVEICKSQMETGMPYILYKDASNIKSNQKNLGTIKSSNLCTEIIEYSSPDETAVCNLASISLAKCVVVENNKRKKYFDFEKLGKITEVITYNLNQVIDRNYYPTEPARNSNLRHRPMGIGVQGLADCFLKLGISFTSEEARLLNKQIFETIYFHALKESNRIASVDGTYESYDGSPSSKGILQFDMWGLEEDDLSLNLNWTGLKSDIKETGLRNSLFVAPMPTASTSQILGNNECFEPYTTNVYSRNTLSGTFMIVNKHLIRDLIELGLWNEDIKNEIVKHEGSVQYIDSIPDDIKELYKTVWEIKQKDLIDMATDRAPFIDQSQSMNIFVANPDIKTISSVHMYTWKKGLKTGMYYLRSRPAKNAQQFTIEQKTVTQVEEPQLCSIDNPDCDSCGA